MSYCYPSSTAMVRTLVQYIDCPHTVQRQVAATFDHAPGVETIAILRARYLRQKAEGKKRRAAMHDTAQTSRDELYADYMQRASAALAERIIMARGISAIERELSQ